MTPLDVTAAAEANRLYWETEDSVADIAERLEISRRALYDAVEPLPTGASCEVCGGPLTFENRSARTAGNEHCAVCAETGVVDEDDDDDADDGAADGAAADAYPGIDVDERTLVVGGIGLAAAAVGALLTFALVPRK
jgi:opacity protein-like surface antigen